MIMGLFRALAMAVCVLTTSAVSGAQPGPAEADTFQKKTVFGVWSKNIFAEAAIVSGPAKTIYLAGMGAEDADTGTILHQGDFLAQCRYSYDKIRKILTAQSATMGDIVKVTSYVTDMRYGPDYARCFAEAMNGVVLPAHTLVNITRLAWPGMMIEVDATAVVPAR